MFNAVISSNLKCTDAFIEFCTYELKQDFYFYSDQREGEKTEHYTSFPALIETIESDTDGTGVKMYYGQGDLLA